MPDDEFVAEAELSTSHILDLVPFSLNPRVYVDELAILDLAGSIASEGLHEPLIVRPTEGGKLEVVAGSRRFAALMHLYEGNPYYWQSVSVRIRHDLKNDDAAAFRLAVTENVERESMNPYDETVALLRLFAMVLYPGSQSATTLSGARLQRLAQFLKAWSHRVESSREVLAQDFNRSVEEVEAAIARVFRMRDGLKFSSFVNNRLPLLELPDDLQDALRTGKFPYTAAKEVGKVEDPVKRGELIQLAFDGMSYRQLIKQAKLMRDPAVEQAADEDTEFIERARQVSKWLRKKPKLNQNDRKQLDAAFRRIEDVFGQ